MVLVAVAVAIPLLGALGAVVLVLRHNKEKELEAKLEEAREAAKRREEEKAAAHGFELKRVEDLSADEIASRAAALSAPAALQPVEAVAETGEAGVVPLAVATSEAA